MPRTFSEYRGARAWVQERELFMSTAFCSRRYIYICYLYMFERVGWNRRFRLGGKPKRPLHGAVWCAFLGISPLSCAPSDPSSHWELHIQSSGCRLVPWPYQQGRGRRNPSHNSVHNEVRSQPGVPRWRRSFVIYNILQTAKLGPSKTPHDICPLR